MHFFCGLSVQFNYRLMLNAIVDFVVQENVWQLCECGLCRTVNFAECRGRTSNSEERIAVHIGYFFVFSVFFLLVFISARKLTCNALVKCLLLDSENRVIIPCRSKKLHHFIFVITLPKIIKIELGLKHMYCN